MTGVVFIVCVPSEKYETNLRRKKKRVIIKENKVSIDPELNDKTKERGRSTDSLSGNKSGTEGESSGFMESSPIRAGNYEYTSMHKLIQDILKWYKLERNASTLNIDENYVQIIFAMEEGQKCEDVLNILREHYVGQRYDSTISIIPCSLYYQGCENGDETFTIENLEKKDVPDTAWTRFVSSVRARLTVAQIVEVLKTEAALTFDFICLVVIAAILCAIGLVENSNVYLLSSMLISPMMGPVMAGTFGTVIRDRMLQKTGVQSELIGLGIATLVGFCYGSIICLCTDKYGDVDWPTSEMLSRGQTRTLGVGCLIALLSGAAVALGVLSDNIASLVGVAISTSLMPPAVNAGLLWSMAIVYYVKGDETSRYIGLSYTEYYSTNRFNELTSLGAVSLCLTFVNIICIYAAGILVFKIKEVAPITLRDQARRQFWKHDIKIARDYNKILHKEEIQTIDKQLESEILNYKTEVMDRYEQFHHSSELSRDNVAINMKNQYTWSPYSFMPKKRPTIEELKDLYSNLIIEKNLSPIITRPERGHKRLSQIFNFNDSSQSPKPDECLDLIPEDASPRRYVLEKEDLPKTKGKKFIVTPCSLD